MTSHVATQPFPRTMPTPTPPRPPSRYRHPSDVIRLILGGAVLVVVIVVVVLATDSLYGPRATTVRGAEPATTGGHVVVGLVQFVTILGFMLAGLGQLRYRRFRLVGTVAGSAVVAGLAFVALARILAGEMPARLSRALDSGSWVASAHFPSAAWFAAGAAVAVALGPWLTRPWRRAMWTVLVVVALARIATGTALPVEILLAFAVGTVVAAGTLVAFGSPDRRLGASGVAAALSASGLAVTQVDPASVSTKGSVAFIAHTREGASKFVKVMGRDQRDADLLYRGYRFVRLRGLGDVRPAASLSQAAEHQALVGIMAGRAGVRAPEVSCVAESEDGSALIAMEMIDGEPMSELAPEAVTDEMLVALWTDVGRMHASHIAHRSLRTGNVLVDRDGRPRIVDFSFSELSATDRQIAVDRAELLASSAVLVGPERAVSTAVAVAGAEHIAPAVPLLQPLALSASTRRALQGQNDLIGRTRTAAAEATGVSMDELAHIQRVKPRTLLMIAVLAGAFYFLLPQLANVSNAWKAFKSASFGWIPVIIALSFMTYVGAALGVMGTVPQRLKFLPTLLAQIAGSFVNRVTPASIGSMVMNGRYLQKSGVDPPTSVAGVALNSVAGGIVHVVLLVVFFTWSGSQIGRAFTLPSGSKMLVVVAVLFAVAGLALAT
ncbi:MAG: hypothetical protein QOI55_792, partial [Actinomycetota bacterium]|nr:hypothetical protein [Actinomycetota bacterium]